MLVTKTTTKRSPPKFFIENLMDYFESEWKSFREFCNEKGLMTKRVALTRVGNKVGLFEAKAHKSSPSFIRRKLLAHFAAHDSRASQKMKELHESNKLLTDDEIALFVSTYQELSIMGLRIDKNACLRIVNGILSTRIDKTILQASYSWSCDTYYCLTQGFVRVGQGQFH